MIVELYRGITVRPSEASAVVSDIQARGIDGTEGLWKFQVPEDIGSAQKLARNALDDSLTFESVWNGPAVSGICACGSRDGATFYASKHNVSHEEGKTFPLIVTFRASLDRIYVDCRDFMMSAFQSFDRESSTYVDAQRSALMRVFGEMTLLYFDKCRQTNNQQERIRQGNIAAFDPDVIRSHLSNKILLEGRYKTMFRSAFFVSAPILPSEIVSVEECQPYSPLFATSYSLHDFFSGRHP